MITQVTHNAEIQPKATHSVKQFNATLPIAIEVLQKLSPTRYMLKLGNTTLITKSLNELLVGTKYWAQMSKNADGLIALSNLIMQPKILTHLSNAPLRFNEEQLRDFENKPNPWEHFKNALFEKAATAENKAEFNFYMQMLLSLHNKVLTLPLNIQERESLLQMRKKRSKGLYEIEFYAVFSMLGALRGRLLSDGTSIDLYINTPFQSTAILLQNNIQYLKGIARFAINVQKDVQPLYEFKESHSSLIDIKG